MGRLFLVISLFAASVSFAQTSSVSIEENKKHTLNERYDLMKSNSQTYQDYKVIKEFVLDGVWKIVTDSIKEQKLQMAQSRERITQLEASLQATEMTLKKERDASAEVTHDSTHISVLAIEFKKSAFLTLATFLFAGFVVAIGLIVGKMRSMNVNMKEKVLIADLITHEYDDFKKRSLDKQMKLSRELQSERNKLEELKAQYR